MNKDYTYCLSIAGFDPTAGAGILADIKTFEAFGTYGMGIITANTTQTDSNFIAAQWVNTDFVIAQMELLMHEYDIRHIKIGLVESFVSLKRIVEKAKILQPECKIIWDPILKSSSGFRFHNSAKIENSFLENNCFLITPNADEFSILWQTDTVAIEDIVLKGNVLLKGGHRKEKKGCDVLFSNEMTFEIDGLSFGGKTKHGTGCVLSAAITANLANAYTLLDSCKMAKRYVEKFILNNNSNLGLHDYNKIY